MQSTSISLLIAPVLLERDRDALKSAVGEERESILQQEADELVLRACGLGRAHNDTTSDLLAWLVAKGILEVRFAFPGHVSESGIYHEKIGTFDFPNGESVAFTGSANETRGGHISNYESLDVYRSWIPEDASRVTTKSEQFDDAWGGAAYGLEVLKLSEAALARVTTYAGTWTDPPGTEPTEPITDVDPRWRHQDEAVARFLSQQQGILEMATGTGKTRTALRIIRELFAADKIETVVIAADGNDLLDQWAAELLPLAVSHDPSLTLLRHYGPHHDTDRFVHSPGRVIMLSSRLSLGGALRPLAEPERVLLIHDEVHKLGSPGNRRSLAGLSDRIIWRLGLSATPEREYDDEGTEFIKSHIGEVIYEFDLTEAITRRVLCQFAYAPIYYEPNDDDRERTARVYKMRAARKAEGRAMTDAEFWTELARVHKTSLAKLSPFEVFVNGNPGVLDRCIVFVETKEYGERVLPLIHAVHPEFHTYFEGEDKAVLRRFASGELGCVVTCHRLSEGIDIRSLKNVVLFSSARARLETIQRIGRCLRWDPDDPAKLATVVDFVRLSAEEERNTDTERAEWLVELASVNPETEHDS
jgi:superfamily II DNA or RNA helicase